MQWLERMNRALDYIEMNMEGDINYDEVAKMAMCSSYHFQRMFSFITDIPLAEYIRRRRLTLAAQELRNPGAKVIDVALKYGYDSPDAFSRAFQRMHGVTPSAAREPGAMLKAYPRISFYLTLKGDKEMEYKIVERESFKMFGKSMKATLVDGHCFKAIPEFWKKCHEDGTCERIREIAGYPPGKEINAKQIGSAIYGHKPDGNFKYAIVAEHPGDVMIEPFEVLDIPKATWAVFVEKCAFDEALTSRVQNIWKRIPEWFEATGYEHAEVPAFECLHRIESGKVGEVWIPVVKKQY